MTMLSRIVTIGEVSSGTLRDDDLIEAFGNELGRILKAQGADADADHVALVASATAAMDEDEDTAARALLDFGDADSAKPELIAALHDALDTYAPDYAYFGAHVGDGACFGFWPCLDAIDELPRVSDPAEVEAMGEDCAFVNDHGNVTVYSADGSILWDCV